MEIEYEATFLNISKDNIRNILKQIGANLVKPEVVYRRKVFDLPDSKNISNNYKWIRVRDESDKVTFSYKEVKGDLIENQKEIMVTVDSFDNTVELLEIIGCKLKSYQESKREIWIYNECEICIDEWPFLEPFVEIEGRSEDEVKKSSQDLGFNYEEAFFGSADVLYSKKYNLTRDEVQRIKVIKFTIDNPFTNNK